MKKVMLSLGVVAAAALSLVSCQKEMSNPDGNPAVKGTPFEIIATSADTKTVNNGLATEWAGDESINLFYAAAGETTYNNGGEFTTTDTGASVKFNGTLDASKLGDSNDWYAFYPYNKDIESPANGAKVSGKDNFTTLGHTNNGSLTQNGVDNKSHLAGDNLPMYAIASGVEKGTTPELAFHHLASIIKVHVTNSTSETLTISSVSFTAPEDIVGTYCIDYTATPVIYTKSGDNYVGTTANLNVTNAEIATGAAADFYLAIKPFTAKAGSTLKLAVNGNEKAIELTNDVTFTASNIKPLNFNYDSSQKKCTINFNDINTVSSLCASVPNSNKNVTITKELTTSEGFVLSTTNGGTTTRINNVGGKYEMRIYSGGTMTLTAPVGYVMTKIAFNSPENYATFDDWEGESSSHTFNCSTTLYKISTITITYQSDNAPKTPSIVCSDVTGLSARKGNFDLTYTITNPIEGTTLEVLCDGTVVTEATASEGSISYSIAANTTTEAREGSITLTYGDITKVITVSQNAPVFKVSRTEVELAATAGAKTTITLTSDFNWMAYASNADLISVSPEVCDYDTDGYIDGKTTVTISAKAGNTADSAIELGTVTFTNEATEEELIVSVRQKGIAVLQSIAWTGYTTSYMVNDTFKKDGTVTATYSDGSTTNVTADATFSEPDMTTAGEKTVTVTYEGKETTGTITIQEIGESILNWNYVVDTTSPTFNSENPITINEAIWSITMGEQIGTPTNNGKPANAYKSCGWQWGNSSSKYWASYTLSTDYFNDKKIKSVAVNILNNGSKAGTIVVKQGNITIGTETKTFGQTWTTLTANTTQGAGGTLTIEYSVAQASFIHSIEIEYVE
ncbi:MAG: bacterial Ig-like domain-containing protein [Candidatus Cryptobacteroides sp.]